MEGAWDGHPPWKHPVGGNGGSVTASKHPLGPSRSPQGLRSRVKGCAVARQLEQVARVHGVEGSAGPERAGSDLLRALLLRRWSSSIGLLLKHEAFPSRVSVWKKSVPRRRRVSPAA